ncbi:hypothetical protein EFB08_22160 [Rufibacter latericius]|uniref:Uncharacterized protein n=1 Tax=Rufibacter latericius TaxID=2487040 RepID=A0A3M9MAG5_9BACT|nr:hypothetical protein EFB08_22160 [Rufibacter latericius]
MALFSAYLEWVFLKYMKRNPGLARLLSQQTVPFSLYLPLPLKLLPAYRPPWKGVSILWSIRDKEGCKPDSREYACKQKTRLGASLPKPAPKRVFFLQL